MGGLGSFPIENGADVNNSTVFPKAPHNSCCVHWHFDKDRQ